MIGDETRSEELLENEMLDADDSMSDSTSDSVDDTAESAAPAVGVVSSSGDVPARPTWQPLNQRQRRIMGVMMEKAKTTPDAYPLSLSSLVAGVNQKSNRAPLMNMTPEQIEDELTVLRRIGAAAEVQGSGRVPRYRHYAHTWLGVKGVEAAVLIELILRGQQTAGDLRTRASRFEPIADLAALQTILETLMASNLVIALTPPGRGQLFTHNLYMPEELENLRTKLAAGGEDGDGDAAPRRAASPRVSAAAAEVVTLKAELAELRAENDRLRQRIEELSA